MEDVKFGYMCKTEFDWEIGETTGIYGIYPSIEELKEKRKCVESCGIIKVTISFVEIVTPENRDWSNK